MYGTIVLCEVKKFTEDHKKKISEAIKKLIVLICMEEQILQLEKWKNIDTGEYLIQ